MKQAASVQRVLLSLAVLLGLMGPQVAAQCQDNYWPVFAGGSKGNEDVRCFIYDPIEQLIVVGGVTTSEDFAPAPNDHGYLYALDLQANWKWGFFFYNVSYAVSQIDGCSLSSDGSSLAVMGLGNSQPLLMDISTRNGTFNRFISLDYVHATADVVPTYTTTGAIYYDKYDYRDFQPYFYTSFLKDNAMFLLRVVDGLEFRVDWNYKFIDDSATSDKLLNTKETNYIVPGSDDVQVLYMIGRYQGKGSVIRFNKRDGQIRYHASITEMSRINSVAQA